MPTSFQLFYFNYLVQSIVSFSLYAQPRQYFSSKSPFTVSLCHKKYNSFVLCENAMLAKLAILNLDELYDLFTETERNSVFCGPETAIVEGSQNMLFSRGLSK